MLALTLLLFCIIGLGVFFIGYRFWLRPTEAINRVTGIEDESLYGIPSHPSLVFHDLVKRLGSVLPASPRDVGIARRRLIRAGIKGENAIKVLYGCKVVFGITLPLIAAALVSRWDSDSTNKVLAVLAAGGVGFFGPNQYVSKRAQRRQKQIQRGLANALDLLVICVESGLGLDQAMVQMAKDLEQAHPEISDEFITASLEMKGGKRRADALRNLAARTSVDDLKKLTGVLIQADRFGTGVAQSLRAHADYMRVQARQVAEEKAAKLGVKLIFPIFFCILPSLFVVTLGPMAFKIAKELSPVGTKP